MRLDLGLQELGLGVESFSDVIYGFVFIVGICVSQLCSVCIQRCPDLDLLDGVSQLLPGHARLHPGSLLPRLLLLLLLLLLLEGPLPLEVSDEDVAVLRVHPLQVLLALLRVQAGQTLLVRLHDLLLVPAGARLGGGRPRLAVRLLLHRRPPRLHAQHAAGLLRRRLRVQRLALDEVRLARVADELLLRLLTAGRRVLRQDHVLLLLRLVLRGQHALGVLAVRPQRLLAGVLLRHQHLLRLLAVLRRDYLLLWRHYLLLRRHNLLLGRDDLLLGRHYLLL